MKYMVGTATGDQTVFAVVGDNAVDLTALDPAVGTDLMALIHDAGLAKVTAEKAKDAPTIPVSSITPALPVAKPGKIICLGLNYVDHAKEGGFGVPDYPAFFMRNAQSVMAAGAPMVRPVVSEQLDYEAELMVVIGQQGRYITEAAANDHIFGYTTFNDGSVRDYQMKSPQWTPGKNFDNTGAIGPVVVTPDDLPADARGLRIESRVGHEVLQSSNTDNMIWTPAQAVAILSEFTTLMPGDLIALGTPPGVGMAKQPGPRWLKPGEVIEVEIEGIGICANPVVDEAASAG